MRSDAIGLFWNDSRKYRKRKPVPQTWLNEIVLPHYDEAVAFNIPIASNQTLLTAYKKKQPILFDIESYPNYFLIAGRNYVTGEVVFSETFDEPLPIEEQKKWDWIFKNCVTIGFNSLNYDLPITSMALAGKTPAEMHTATQRIIAEGERPYMVLRSYKVKQIQCNHIDLIEVAFGKCGLKEYAARLYCPRIQDLPYSPGTVLTREQAICVRWYCVNSDIVATGYLARALTPQLELRTSMSQQYGIDLRSKSDAQIAEAVIKSELTRITGIEPKRPEFVDDFSFQYKAPEFLKFKTDVLKNAFDVVTSSVFYLSAAGKPIMPEELSGLNIKIGSETYRMGMGGLHSSESCRIVKAENGFRLMDVDVTSYYPATILNLGLAPDHLGAPFLQVMRQIVDRRVAAKKAKNKVVADTLKIVVNGTYGKLGEMFSVIYSPNLMIQVTLTGQLSLLMLIETLELEGISVISGNTDGIVIMPHESQLERTREIIKEWESVTGYEMEETHYQMIVNRDVNTYFAVKEDGSIKRKGVFVTTTDVEEASLHKSPFMAVVGDAVINKIVHGVPIEDTINSETNFKKFLCAKKVTGGAALDEPNGTFTYLGKVVRWYYGDNENEIVIVKSGNKVGSTDKAIPAMELQKEIPADLNRQVYIDKAYELLANVGYSFK